MPDLISQWQTGDTAAFEMLFRQYGGLVFKTAFLITGRREDAEDILQEVFVSVWKSRRTFDPARGKLTTWLHQVTVNRCLEKRRRKRPDTELLDLLDPVDTSCTQEEAVMKKQERESLLRSVNSLDLDHRTVLVLRYFNDMSYQEIATATGAPLGTVRSRIHYALRALRDRLGETLPAAEGQFTLERIELTATGMKVYAVYTPQGYTMPGQPPNFPPPPMLDIHAWAEYQLDGAGVRNAGSSGINTAEVGITQVWDNLDPVAKTAGELTFRITRLEGFPGQWQGPWEFRVRLDQ